MSEEPVDVIYRAMVEDKAMPKVGQTATTLGIRLGVDIVADMAGLVHLPNFEAGKPNGLSCAPTIQDLPAFALPVEWGGLNKKTAEWKIILADLAPELVAKNDSAQGSRRQHISVGPAKSMNLADFLMAIEKTQPMWTKVVKT
jgi:hypothetical protein